MNNLPQIGDRIKGATAGDHPREVEGVVVGIDPKPYKLPRTDFMYYLVKTDTGERVYMLSRIPTGA